MQCSSLLDPIADPIATLTTVTYQSVLRLTRHGRACATAQERRRGLCTGDILTSSGHACNPSHSFNKCRLTHSTCTA